MTNKPTVSYKGKTTLKDQPGQVVVNFIEDNQEILIKLKHFHYEVMLKLIHDTPRKALEYAKGSGVTINPKTQKHYIINLEDGIDLEDTQKGE